MNQQITAQDFGGGLISFLKMLAALVAAVGVVSSVFWFAAEPRVMQWLQEREAPTIARLEGIETAIKAMQAAIEREEGPPYIEFVGNGIVRSRGPFAAGDAVPMIYQLRRNKNCSTTIQVRFISAVTGNIDTSLTYEIPSTRAPITQDFIPFPVQIRLPDNMPPGRWSYAPLLLPENCPTDRPVEAPISEFFDVT